VKQVLQHLRTGEITVADVPAPQLLPGCVLVRIAASLVSAGTERASSEFASKNLFQKARARPDLVRDVLSKIRRDGLLSAVEAVRSRLEHLASLGYSSAGTVIGVGEGIRDIATGDRVACAGAGYAVHAEAACIPRLLLARIPEGASVSFDEAAFTTVGAIALHGVRTADVKLGDVVAVIGLGLLGQITVQLLKAAGCRVLGMDIAADRSDLARRLGADVTCTAGADLQNLCLQQTRGFGVDAVLITAETPSSEPVNLAARLARDRAVVVAVGTVGMEIERRIYYEKELEFRVSRSYGPGRYDSAYEQKGRDYPIGHVRWTETRNMESFLQLLSDRNLDVNSLITHRFSIEDVPRAYDMISGKTHEPFLGVLITYPEQSHFSQRVQVAPDLATRSPDAADKILKIGVIGAGSFATSTLLPAIQQVNGVELVAVCSATGASSRSAADKFRFRYCTTDDNELVHDPTINTVAVATRHHLHARQVLAALAAGKHVFCEKPLCLREEDLAEIVRVYSGRPEGKARSVLMVGFNRRFSPLAIRMSSFLGELGEPLAMHYRVNAGFLPPDHWVHDPEEGGGRILGEVCHFVDFLSYLAGSQPVEVSARGVADAGRYSGDNVLVSLQFANGSVGTISYLATGDKVYSKERIEVFGGGAVATLEDFRRLELVRHGRQQTITSRWRQDKGHHGEWDALAACVCAGHPAPIPFEDIVSTTLTTLKIVQAQASGQTIRVETPAFISEALGFRPAGE
jgi:predicted dehydrogenase/threonine dehydrogenase-like Zn-dependent dehydrogenase